MKENDRPANRRDFLKLAGAGAPVAVLAAATGTAAGAEPADEVRGAGLRRTAHVDKYMETARF